MPHDAVVSAISTPVIHLAAAVTMRPDTQHLPMRRGALHCPPNPPGAFSSVFLVRRHHARHHMEEQQLLQGHTIARCAGTCCACSAAPVHQRPDHRPPDGFIVCMVLSVWVPALLCRWRPRPRMAAARPLEHWPVLFQEVPACPCLSV